MAVLLEEIDKSNADRTPLPQNLLSVLGCNLETRPGSFCIIVRYFMLDTMCCMASAVSYLHDQKIRHKDLKPANVLLSPGGRVWLADLGSSTDFSEFSESVTDGGERGTRKYSAPEVAAFAPRGRSADIFSLGCVFLEMLWVGDGDPLLQLRDLRSHGDGSFQADVENVSRYLERDDLLWNEDGHILQILMMIQRDPVLRPTAADVCDTCHLLRHVVRDIQHEKVPMPGGSDHGHDDYIRNLHVPLPPAAWRLIQLLNFEIGIGNSVDLATENVSDYPLRWHLFVSPSQPAAIERIRILLPPSASEPRMIDLDPPWRCEIKRSSRWPRLEVIVIVVLNKWYGWSDHPYPWPNNIPGGISRVKAFRWPILFDSPSSRMYRNFVIGYWELSRFTISDQKPIPRRVSAAYEEQENTALPGADPMQSLSDLSENETLVQQRSTAHFSGARAQSTGHVSLHEAVDDPTPSWDVVSRLKQPRRLNIPPAGVLASQKIELPEKPSTESIN